jgi:hypothetical protein
LTHEHIDHAARQHCMRPIPWGWSAAGSRRRPASWRTEQPTLSLGIMPDGVLNDTAGTRGPSVGPLGSAGAETIACCEGYYEFATDPFVVPGRKDGDTLLHCEDHTKGVSGPIPRCRCCTTYTFRMTAMWSVSLAKPVLGGVARPLSPGRRTSRPSSCASPCRDGLSP